MSGPLAPTRLDEFSPTSRGSCQSEMTFLRIVISILASAPRLPSAAVPARRSSTLRVLFQEFDGITHRQDRLGGIVRNLAAELFLEGHDQLDGVEAVGPEIVDETGVFGDLVRLDAQMFHDDLFHPFGNVTHAPNLARFAKWLGRPRDFEPRSLKSSRG